MKKMTLMKVIDGMMGVELTAILFVNFGKIAQNL